jgi:tripartite-type tricarboxylate transporter receptor subunit TctC
MEPYSVRTFARIAIWTLLGAAIFTTPAAADETDTFFGGRRVSLVIGYSTGGGYDQIARLFGRHVGRHIPGQPQVIPQNMPGAGSRTAANWLYNTAPKDGTAIATLGQNTALDQALGEPNVQFDVRRFNWLGNVSEVNNVLAIWHGKRVREFKQAKEIQLSIGATGASSPSVIYPRASNMILGTKFQIVTGYPGSAEIMLAMERGEVDGRGSSSWVSWIATRPDWVRENKIIPLFQVGSRQDPAIGQAPLWSDLADNDSDKEVLVALSASITIGYSMIAPPEVPQSRVEVLRRAFTKTMDDPHFLSEASKQDIIIHPVSGEDVQRVASRVANLPPHIVARLKEVLSAKP